MSSAGIYLLNVNYRNGRTRCEICLKLMIKTLERRHSEHSVVFVVNFQHILQLFLISNVSIVNFEHVIADGEEILF